jgi:hypothetical protein
MIVEGLRQFSLQLNLMGMAVTFVQISVGQLNPLVVKDTKDAEPIQSKTCQRMSLCLGIRMAATRPMVVVLAVPFRVSGA